MNLSAFYFSGDFLVTVEKHKLDTNSNVRVYTNMQKATSQKPLRASLRLTSSDDSKGSVDRAMDGPSVIEIPLKDNPKCIAIENCTGNMAVSVTSSSGLCRLLIYGLFCKRIVQSASTYR
jgi:Hermansky-Pudlak syndrome 3